MIQVTLHDSGRLISSGHVIRSDPLKFLGHEVKMAPTTTLRTFFQCLHRYPGLVALNPFLESFMEHYAQCSADGCTCDELDGLALSRIVELIGHPPPPRMVLSVSLDGVRGEQRCDIRHYWLENLLDMPLKLGCLNHVVFGDKINTMQFETVFNLFELIDGICWQLSFHNLPATCRLTP